MRSFQIMYIFLPKDKVLGRSRQSLHLITPVQSFLMPEEEEKNERGRTCKCSYKTCSFQILVIPPKNKLGSHCTNSTNRLRKKHLFLMHERQREKYKK